MTLGNEVRATGRGKGTAASVLSVSFLTASGLLLRILSLNSRGLWLDEAITVGQATRSWADVIRTLAGGVHPPLYHLIMHFWISQFGRGEIAIRSFALLVGVVAIPAAFWAGARIYDRRTGIIAAGLVAWSPFQIWYSQEARMYELLFLTGLLSIAFLVLAIRENRVHLWVGYFLWTLMGLFTHYFFLFLMVGEVGYYLLGELVPQERQLKAMGTAKAALRRPWSLFSDVRTFGPWLSCSLLMAVLLLMWAFNSVLVSASDGPNALLSSVSGSGLGYGQEGARLAFRFDDVAAVVVQMTAGFHSPACHGEPGVHVARDRLPVPPDHELHGIDDVSDPCAERGGCRDAGDGVVRSVAGADPSLPLLHGGGWSRSSSRRRGSSPRSTDAWPSHYLRGSWSLPCCAGGTSLSIPGMQCATTTGLL